MLTWTPQIVSVEEGQNLTMEIGMEIEVQSMMVTRKKGWLQGEELCLCSTRELWYWLWKFEKKTLLAKTVKGSESQESYLKMIKEDI